MTEESLDLDDSVLAEHKMIYAAGSFSGRTVLISGGGAAAGYVTGETLHVAGGSQLWGETWTIPRPDYFKI